MYKGMSTLTKRCARSILFGALFTALLSADLANAQAAPQNSQPPGASPSTAASPSASTEMSSQESTPVFKVNVKEVLVRVVARDPKGNAVGNLTKEDFQVFDQGKAQVITHFSVERPGAQAAEEQKTSDENPGTLKIKEPAAVPERFVAYLFDDIHLQFGDLARVRDAAQRQFATLHPTDRAAVFTTSGKTMLDYSDDRAKLQDALLRLRPNPVSGSGTRRDCPDISYYMADLIVNKQDAQVMQIAAYDALSCNGSYSAVNGVVTGAISAANTQAMNAAHMALERGEVESRLALGTLKGVVQELGKTPGARSVVLISPGFIIPELDYEFNDIVDKALKSQVIISTLDARGLYALIPGGDADKPGPPDTPQGVVSGVDPSTLPPPAAYLSTFDSQQALANTDILASFADATGGIFFHNSNDLDEGFRRTAATPEYFYLLGFAPQNLKPDGKFHILKVVIKPSQKLSVQARRGYYAPKHLVNQEEEAKQEIQDAIFSQEEMHDVPLQLHTQFFKTGDAQAQLTVLAHMDIRQLHYRKAEGRNNEELVVVAALFDHNGTFIKGDQKTVTFRLKDDTLASKLNSGITMKTNFDTKPGTYLVRVVIRDADGQMSAENGAVEIPQ
jgi:VWFA-related protein